MEVLAALHGNGDDVRKFLDETFVSKSQKRMVGKQAFCGQICSNGCQTIEKPFVNYLTLNPIVFS